MKSRFIFPVAIYRYDEALQEAIKAIRDNMQDDEMAETHKDNPNLQQYLNSKRPKYTPMPETSYKNTLESLFDPEKDSSFDDYMGFGGIVLTESEAKKLGLNPDISVKGLKL